MDQKSLQKQFQKDYEAFLHKVDVLFAERYYDASETIKQLIFRLFEKYADKDGKIGRVDYQYRAKINELKLKHILNEMRSLKKEVDNVIGAALISNYTATYLEEIFRASGFGDKILNKDNKLIVPTTKSKPEYLYTRKIKWTDATTKLAQKYGYNLKVVLASKLKEGANYFSVAKEVSRVTNASYAAALRIVRTELHRVQTLSKLKAFDEAEQSFKRLGLESERIWNSLHDSRTRDTHIAMDQQRADEEGLFTLSGKKVRGPGLTGIASEDINCRCFITQQVKGGNTEPEGDLESFEDWVNDTAGLTYDGKPVRVGNKLRVGLLEILIN